MSYGGKFDYDSNELRPSGELDEALQPLRVRVAAWAGLAPDDLVHALVAEYAPGTPLGWHRDVPDFESIFGVSLDSDALLRFRPYPPDHPRKEDVVKLNLMPRSIYAMRGAARWAWQHSVAPVHTLRWSITFRRLGDVGRRGAAYACACATKKFRFQVDATPSPSDASRSGVRRQRRIGRMEITDEEIVEMLAAEAPFPVDRWRAFTSRLTGFFADSGRFYVHVIKDDERAVAVVNFLVKRGQVVRLGEGSSVLH